MTAQPLISLQNVSVNYGFRKAIHNVDLTVETGQSVGLLGANGAGKTSTIRALLGMVKPKSGTISVMGRRPGDIRSFREIGFAPEDGGPPDYLTCREYLEVMARFKVPSSSDRAKQVEELLTSFELEPSLRVAAASKGNKRRLLLAQAFLGTPRFIVLDEPLNGLDPLLILKFRDRLTAARQAGVSMLYSSHILAEVEKCCTHIIVLKSGEVLASLTVAEMLKKWGSVEKGFAELMGRPAHP